MLSLLVDIKNMNNPDSQKIVLRFFEALDRLKSDRVIHGHATFSNRYGIDRRNLMRLHDDPSSDIFQPAWLEALVRDYKVSPLWLITGEGAFLRDGWDLDTLKAFVPPLRRKSVDCK